MPGNRAAVYSKPGQNIIEIKDLDVPEPAADQVLVKFTHSGVCHSDLHVMQQDWPWLVDATVPGRVGGHEGIGKVTKVGSAVTNVKVGQSVGVKWLSSVCLSCEQCLAGKDAFCAHQQVSGATVDGTFQEYAVQDAKYVTPIPDGIDPAEASVILCAGVTVYSAIKKAGLQQGEWLAISGAGGGLGHLGIQYAKAMGYKVVAIDGGSKSQLCKKMGADAFVDFMKQDVKAAVAEATDGLGAHALVVVTAALPSYKVACSLVRTSGTVVCVGIPGKACPIDVDANEIIVRDLQIRGSAVGSRAEVLEALAFCARGQVKPILQVRKLENLQEIFEEMKLGEIGGRIVVEIKA